MPDKPVIYAKDGHIARITLNRPLAANRVNAELAREIQDACATVNQDDDIYVVILIGAGEAFCAGSEETGTDVAETVAEIEKPVIAAVNGEAFDEGFELALACDIRLASDKASFHLGQVARGKLPSNGGTQRLPRLIGKGKALELILTGDTISAQEAYEIGLVSKVVPHDKLAAEADALAQKLVTMAPISLRFVKEAVNKGMDMTLPQGLRLEGDLYFLLHTTADRTEGIRAFLEKRKAQFEGK